MSNKPASKVDGSPYAWARLGVSLALMTISGCSMYAVVVVLPAVQAEFGIARADASLPYALTMIGFGVGGLFMGRLADRFGVMVPVLIGAVSLGIGFALAGMAGSIWTFSLAHGLLIGACGSSALFAPLIADTSLWFTRRRGIAVAICASGNYVAGAIWPPVVNHFVAMYGWRNTYEGIGLFCVVTLSALALFLRRRPPAHAADTASSATGGSSLRPFGFSPAVAQSLLCVAGIACCVAMSMPQVHIVAYCGDLGYGVARGAEMLSVMLGFGIVSRLLSGMICDRIGGLPVRNFSNGRLVEAAEGPLQLGGDFIRELNSSRGGQISHACMPGCMIECSNVYVDENGKELVSPLEYETLGLMGSNCGLTHPDQVARVNAVANDLGFGHVYTRQVLAHLGERDCLVGISTSGNSDNLLAGFAAAKRQGAATLGLAGGAGGRMRTSPDVDLCLVVATDSIHRVQETHVTLYHILWDLTHTLLADDRVPARAPR